MRVAGLLVVAVCAVGYGREPAPVTVSIVDPFKVFATSPADATTPRSAYWYACDESAAAKFLVTELTVPSLKQTMRRETPLASTASDNRKFLFHPLIFFVCRGCGSTGSSHDSICVTHSGDDPDEITLEIEASWDFDKGRLAGKFEQKIALRIDQPVKFILNDGFVLAVSWRDAEPKP